MPARSSWMVPFSIAAVAQPESHAYMLDVATGGASRRTDVKRPLPARFIGSSTDGHPADVHNLELPFFKGASLIRLLKTLQKCLDGVHIGALPKRASENALDAALLHYLRVGRQREQREIQSVEVVHQVEHAREAGSSVELFVP